jgi:FAD/FMN-containing dehydrogenase
LQNYLEAELGKTTVDMLRTIKKSIDPQNIMVS